MVPWVGLQYVIVVFPEHTHLLFGALIVRVWRVYITIVSVLYGFLWNIAYVFVIYSQT